MINALPSAPDRVLFMGDLTHDTEEKDVHAQRMRQFQDICKRMKVGKVMYVPGEHDAGLDGGQLYREFFKETYYSFPCISWRWITCHARSRKLVRSNWRD